MKKRITAICALAMLLSVFSGCCLKHDWAPATCEAPEVCSECGKTQGEPLGHSWAAATCEAPETCTVCAGTRGEPLGHSWDAATCEIPETCSVCGKTQGEPVGHTARPEKLFAEGEGYVLVSTCDVCQEEIREETEDWNEASRQIVLGEWHFYVYDARMEDQTLVLRQDGTATYDIGEGPVETTWATRYDYMMEDDSSMEGVARLFSEPVALNETDLACQYSIEIEGMTYTLLHASEMSAAPRLAISHPLMEGSFILVR